LNEVKTVNFLDNLAGKIAGVTITQGPTGVGIIFQNKLEENRLFQIIIRYL
jgi:hypothetical protein